MAGAAEPRLAQVARLDRRATGHDAGATSAPGLGSPLPHLPRDWARLLPHLHRDWAHPRIFFGGTALTSATSARGLGSPHVPHLLRDLRLRLRHLCTGMVKSRRRCGYWFGPATDVLCRCTSSRSRADRTGSGCTAHSQTSRYSHMQHATRIAQRASRNAQRAACNAQHATRRVHRATRNTQRCNTQHATLNTQHAECTAQHASRSIATCGNPISYSSAFRRGLPALPLGRLRSSSQPHLRQDHRSRSTAATSAAEGSRVLGLRLAGASARRRAHRSTTPSRRTSPCTSTTRSSRPRRALARTAPLAAASPRRRGLATYTPHWIATRARRRRGSQVLPHGHGEQPVLRPGGAV